MWIVIGTQTNKGIEKNRAFIKKSGKSIKTFEKELINLGWKTQTFEVDSIFYNRLELTTERK